MSKQESPSFVRKSELQKAYNQYLPLFLQILGGVESELRATVNLTSAPTYKTRVKSFPSYLKKIRRIKPQAQEERTIPVITDLIGIRIICAFLEDLQQVERQITNSFETVEIERKGSDRAFSEFGYESLHILVRIPEDIKRKASEETGLAIPEGLVCEIQIRTILQDAWAEVEHELVYKADFSPFDLPLRRKLASINATLSLADIVFQEIRDYQNRLNTELDQRREAFYEQADFFSREKFFDLSNGGAQETTAEKYVPQPSPFIRGTIDDMILEAIHAHNGGDLVKAVNIYTVIIQSKPEPNAVVLSVIYKHRGMAYFAQNKYAEALSDFTKSSEYDPKNFRAFYYIGIVCAIQNRDEDAIGYFDTSLSINPYQAHVYYRRSLSKYHLCQFDDALVDIQTAMDMGLDEPDAKRLYETLQVKLELKF